MSQPVVGPRKAGLNFHDINLVREAIERGEPLVQIQTQLSDIYPEAVEACYRHYGPKAAPVFVPDPPPSLDEELGEVRPSKPKKG